MQVKESNSGHAPPLVAVVRCADYDEERVYDAVGRGLALLGGVERFTKPGESILLKPNLLAGGAPEKAVTTHPSVFGAAARHFQMAGARLSFGDSPGFGRPEAVARQSKILEMAEKLGVPLADFGNSKTVPFHEGRLIKQFTIAAGALEADGIISLPKLKTHALTRMTGAVKNQFGCVPGLLKGEFHARLPELDRFVQMLVDLTRLLKPRLYIMDAVVAMEGNGPRGGTPRPVSALLFSADPVALDAAACRMIGLDPELVPTIRLGEELGLGTRDGQLLGDPLEVLFADRFEANRDAEPITASLPRLPAWMLRRYVISRPEIDAAQCTRCGTCIKMCPAQPKALAFPDGDAKQPPGYDYDACIRCYCCQELCPEHAIAIRKTRWGRLLRL